jgi:hypothetical protein
MDPGADDQGGKGVILVDRLTRIAVPRAPEVCKLAADCLGARVVDDLAVRTVLT